MQETWVCSLGQEDPLREEIATHSTLPRKFHGQRSLADYGPWGLKESDMTKLTEHVCKENLLYSIENSTQFSVITYMERKSKKEWIYVYTQLIHFSVHLKLTQHCKETICQ